LLGEFKAVHVIKTNQKTKTRELNRNTAIADGEST
jgi:hypothetical protein